MNALDIGIGLQVIQNELEKLGLIFYAGDKRDGSRIIRHIKYKSVEE